MILDRRGDAGGVGRPVDPAPTQVVGSQDRLDELGGGPPTPEGHDLALTRVDHRERDPPEPPELEVVVDPDHREDPAGDRVEEGLGQLRVGSPGDRLAVVVASLDPDPPPVLLGVQGDQRLHELHAGLDTAAMQIQPLRSVGLMALEVLVREPASRSSRDRLELAVEPDEGLLDPNGDLRSELGVVRTR